MKGATIRRHTVKQHEEELVATYSDGNTSPQGPLIDESTSLTSTTNFVTRIFQVGKIETLDDGGDLFVLGMDSFEVLNIALNIRKGLKTQNTGSNSSISTARMKYANPTVGLFSNALYDFISPDQAALRKSHEVKNGKRGRLSALVDKYTQYWPQCPAPRKPAN